MLSVEVTGPEMLGVTEDGLAEQLANAGRPEHEIATGEVYPPMELTDTVTLAVLPAVTVVLLVDTATPKSAPPPVKVTSCGLSGAESLMVREPVFEPNAVGVKVTLMVQMAPGVTGAPQVVVNPNPAEATIAPTVSEAVPVFLRVTICGGLVAPTTSEGKVRLVGETDTAP
jgi:hypothetical protein